MNMLNTSHGDLQEILIQLEQAIDNHTQWYELLMRTLVCRQPADDRDLMDDAFRRCHFGQWYYSNNIPELSSHTDFIAIEQQHANVHLLATSLLKLEADGEVIPVDRFDAFKLAINNMRLRLQTLKFEVEDVLHNYDPLTRAHTRTGMMIKLRELQEFVKRNLGSCCLVMMDMDEFKAINDTHGHLAGDYVLVSVVDYLRTHLRPYDKIFRYGGEEFLISMPQIDLETGFGIVERLRQGIMAQAVHFQGAGIKVTASFGIALLEKELSIEASIGHADEALYAAKASGRNCTHRWDALPGTKRI